MTFLPQLRDQLAASQPPPARWRSARLISAVVVAGLLVTAGALAATGVIPIGSSVEPPPRFHGDPRVGPGVTVGTSVRLLPLRVRDPAGGPPWGLRVVETSRGLSCVQLGRVVDGRLGVLGQDGIAHDDGRFHELSPRFATLGPGCVPPDADGNPFVAIDARGLASGEGPRRTCLGPGEGSPHRRRCPVADHRRFLYGLLGPEVTELDYRDEGRVRSAPVEGPEGAYLIVLAQRQLGGGGVVGTAPTIGHPFTRITYRDGSVCPAPGATGRARQCPAAGYRPLLAGVDRDSLRRPLRVDLAGRRLRITFRAPVAVDDARLAYSASAHFDRSCPQIYFVPATNRDIRRGAQVQLDMKLPGRCHGVLRGSVFLNTNTTAFPPGPVTAESPASIVVGRFAQRIP